jgi:hypothetical protein
VHSTIESFRVEGLSLNLNGHELDNGGGLSGATLARIHLTAGAGAPKSVIAKFSSPLPRNEGLISKFLQIITPRRFKQLALEMESIECDFFNRRRALADNAGVAIPTVYCALCSSADRVPAPPSAWSVMVNNKGQVSFCRWFLSLMLDASALGSYQPPFYSCLLMEDLSSHKEYPQASPLPEREATRALQVGKVLHWDARTKTLPCNTITAFGLSTDYTRILSRLFPHCLHLTASEHRSFAWAQLGGNWYRRAVDQATAR